MRSQTHNWHGNYPREQNYAIADYLMYRRQGLTPLKAWGQARWRYMSKRDAVLFELYDQHKEAGLKCQAAWDKARATALNGIDDATMNAVILQSVERLERQAWRRKCSKPVKRKPAFNAAMARKLAAIVAELAPDHPILSKLAA